MGRKRPTKYLRLRYAMSTKGFSQQRLCDAYNNLEDKNKNTIYQTELSSWLTGNRPFRLDVAWAIMKILNLPPEDFYLFFPDGGVSTEDGDDVAND